MMIEMYVMGVALDTRTGSPIVVLKDFDDRRALPIWIGSAEASAIIRKIENIKVIRPMTHDLICTLIEQMGYYVEKIEIHDVSEETYFANIVLKNDDGDEKVIDSRPSDAIAIALRTEAPIFVSPSVVASGTVSANEEKDEQETEEFKKFIQDLKPSDSHKLLDDHGESKQ